MKNSNIGFATTGMDSMEFWMNMKSIAALSDDIKNKGSDTQKRTLQNGLRELLHELERN